MSLPTTMKRYTLSHRNDFTGLTLETSASVPQLTKDSQIVMRIKAVSLNARDIQIATNTYPAPHEVPDKLVPVSDGAGEVVQVGSGVKNFVVGDKACPLFPQGHHFEEDMALYEPTRGLCQGLGGAIDGVAAEYFVVDEADAVKIPSYMSYEEAACLPVAPATAWSSIFGHTPKMLPGQTVLCLGTGGVSLAAAQFALLASGKVILTSSSSAKLERCKALLQPLVHPNAPSTAIQTVNYSEIPDWDVEVRRLTGGKGVDFVIEIGGRGTLGKSIRSTRMGGLVAISGYLSDYGAIDPKILEEDVAKLILYAAVNVRGVFVANRLQFTDMVKAMEMSAARPIIDKVFKFEELAEAYEYLQKGRHIGKVVVSV
ncbi:alcohol dehydrogenase [Meredithblackwellia eburnea MCA 4105]